MKITALSDTHGRHKQVELIGGDILIHAGDIEATCETSLTNFLEWFSRQDYKHKIFIGGNHDFYLQEQPRHSEEIVENYGVHYLNMEEVYIPCDKELDWVYSHKDEIPYNNDFLRIYGTPWSKEFNGWAFMKTIEELRNEYKAIPKGVDIIVTHAPPYHSELGIAPNGENVGVKGLPYAKFYICGHIHRGYGIKYDKKYDNTTINCAVLDENYRVNNQPINFEL